MKRIISVTIGLLYSFILQAQDSANLTAIQIAERNKPATVLIETTFKGSVFITPGVSNEEALQELKNSLNYEITLGQLRNDEFWHAYIMAIVRNPNIYILKGTEKKEYQFSLKVAGSGFIISPDGYVVTNCHVVDEKDEVTQQQFAVEAMKGKITNYVNDWVNYIQRQLTKEEEDGLTNVAVWYYTNTMEVGDVNKMYEVVLGVNGTGGKIVPEVVNATLITKGEVIPGKDVAILKLNRGQDYPTVRIGDDKNMQIGEEVFALGYPGVATFNELLSEESITEATLTRGIVSAKKLMHDGWEVLQTDAAITHGNSGGPVFNTKGEVVGLATFGSIDQESHQLVQGMNFIVPSEILDEFVKKAEIMPHMSRSSLLFEQALQLFDKAWYKKSLMKFEEVRELNSAYPFVDQYIATARLKINDGRDAETLLASKSTTSGLLMNFITTNYIDIMLGVLILVVIILSIKLYRKNKNLTQG
jgi:serine protease Do